METESPKKKRGRPFGSKNAKSGSKLTPELIETFCKGIELGLSHKAACAIAGITQTTFRNWQRKGEVAKKGIYREFVDRIEISEGRILQKIETAMLRSAFGQVDTKIRGHKEDPEGGTLAFERSFNDQTLRFFAERRFPEIWGNRQQVTLGGGASPLSIKLVDPTFIPGSAELAYDPDAPDELAE